MPNKGIIMLNGRQYGDTGTNYNVVKCTKQEYDAMTPEQKNNGCLYIVVDSAGNSVNYLSAQVAGAKTDDTMTNLLNPTLATTTINGVTCTNNGDGTYTINGTASANTYFLIARNITIVAGKPMRIVGCPSGGSGNTYKSGLWIEGTAEDDIGLGNTFTLEEDTTFDQFRIVVYAGTTVENLVFKPMLTTDLSASYDDFVAYTGGTGRLNSDVAQHEKEISRINADLSESCKLVNKYVVVTTDVNGNCDITNLYPYIKPENFISVSIDDSGATFEVTTFIYYAKLEVHVKGMYDGQSKPNTQVGLSINYAMPI